MNFDFLLKTEQPDTKNKNSRRHNLRNVENFEWYGNLDEAPLGNTQLSSQITYDIRNEITSAHQIT